MTTTRECMTTTWYYRHGYTREAWFELHSLLSSLVLTLLYLRFFAPVLLVSLLLAVASSTLLTTSSALVYTPTYVLLSPCVVYIHIYMYSTIVSVRIIHILLTRPAYVFCVYMGRYNCFLLVLTPWFTYCYSGRIHTGCLLHIQLYKYRAAVAW
jgi:hypothetical protein